MNSLFTTPNTAKPFFQANMVKQPLAETEVQQLIQQSRARLKEVCGNELQRSGARAQAVSFFGRKANRVLHGIAQEMLDEVSNKTNDSTQAINQIITAINGLYTAHATDDSKPLPSNIVFALTERIGPMLLELHEAQHSTPSQQLSC